MASKEEERRARFTEVMPAHKPLKRKRQAQVAIPMQIANVLPESALFLRLSQLEKRIDATLDNKVERIKDVVDRSQQELTSLVLNKYKIQLYVQLEARKEEEEKEDEKDEKEDEKDEKVEKDEKDEQAFDLYVYGHVEKLKTPGTSDEATPMVVDNGQDGQEEKESLELTDVLKSVTVKGYQLSTDTESGKRFEDLTFKWTSADHSGEGSNCFKTSCKNMLPGSKVKVTWEVKNQSEKFNVPPQIAPILGLVSDTKTNIISRLWKCIKLKGSQTSNEPATVEFSNPTLRRFFSEGEKNSEVKFTAIGQKLRNCLIPCNKPSIQFLIPRPDDVSKPEEKVKSLTFTVQLPACSLSSKMSDADRLLRKVKSTRAVDQVDKDIKKILESINDRKRRRNFFLGFSQSPVNFVSSLIESQQRDLKTMKNFQTNYPTQYVQRSHIFKDAWVHDAAIRYLHQRIASQTTD